ncbi:MAG: type II toxin-antitoxin system VapC family toxin [Myxococcota bacterium]
MKVLFDTSIWVEHLRHGVLTPVIPALRGKYQLWCDSVVAAELTAGCRSKSERRTVSAMLAPFTRAGRLASPLATDFDRAARALSRLSERGRNLSSPTTALLDGLIATVGVRLGALVVTVNHRDFAKLAEELPLRMHAWDVFVQRLGAP